MDNWYDEGIGSEKMKQDIAKSAKSEKSASVPRHDYEALQAENERLKENQFPSEPICKECGKPRRLLGILWATHAKPCKQSLSEDKDNG